MPSAPEPPSPIGRRRGAAAARIGVVAAAGLVLAGCYGDVPEDAGAEASDGSSEHADQRYPDVREVEVEEGSGGTVDLAVTISSPYDTPERYADGWRVKGPDDTVYGEHELAHDHQNEQPFTRTQSGVRIPDGVDEVVVEGRDSEHGYGGATETVEVP
ncbi:hypothetical protein F4561_001584 [Lipingzhangella halophila]|uniref:Uncharacterized protein n=1 Tax=Lipingzhangella halophila TaxID=1783352 RepID=A0A7W7W2G8_9ACTN|nr:hypothetical protein [Lipingzhangella halophila]MBB4930764.1 hypothetical protein [Lipingzhangella halophila]